MIVRYSVPANKQRARTKSVLYTGIEVRCIWQPNGEYILLSLCASPRMSP